MWLSALSLLPDYLIVISCLVSAFEVVQAVYDLLEKGGFMTILSKRVWNLGGS